MSENRLYKCDFNNKPILDIYIVVSRAKNESKYWSFFFGSEISRLDLNEGDYVYLDDGTQIGYPYNYFCVHKIITNELNPNLKTKTILSVFPIFDRGRLPLPEEH